MIGNLHSTARSSMPVPDLSSTPVYRIGGAARRSGVAAASIRYYEREQLLPPTARADNDYRQYSEADVHRLRFIRMCRAMDMTLADVRLLLGLDLNNKRHCATARSELDGHITRVRQRLQELQQLEREMVALRSRCNGTADHCHIIEALHQQAESLPL
jgi:DNA-binding transcriptional MerR regulator